MKPFSGLSRMFHFRLKAFNSFTFIVQFAVIKGNKNVRECVMNAYINIKGRYYSTNGELPQSRTFFFPDVI